jgi:hypothetical protein
LNASENVRSRKSNKNEIDFEIGRTEKAYRCPFNLC